MITISGYISPTPCHHRSCLFPCTFPALCLAASVSPALSPALSLSPILSPSPSPVPSISLVFANSPFVVHSVLLALELIWQDAWLLPLRRESLHVAPVCIVFFLAASAYKG